MPNRTAAGSHIDRRRGLTHAEFVREYLRPLKPVVLLDAVSHWPALGTWTPEFFRRQYGLREVVVDDRRYAMNEVLNLIDQSSEERPAPYIRNLPIAEWAPELLADITPMPRCTMPNWLDSRLFFSSEPLSIVELYVGGAGAWFPILHYDMMHTHAFLMQLHGSKEYTAYAPDQGRFLYPRTGIENNKSSIPDVAHPDLERFPRFADATPQYTRLDAGETLFVPSGWWHTARILEPSITVSINTANSANWRAFCHDYLVSIGRHQPAWRAAARGAYLSVFGRFKQILSTS